MSVVRPPSFSDEALRIPYCESYFWDGWLG